MPSPHFDFKQFRVCHDRCAMKVGTDGVLLGAWAEVEGCRHLLDIGTGSGLIALMAAQRTAGAAGEKAQIVGIETDEAAALQAAENAGASPFAENICIVNAALQEHMAGKPYDCILSNPPFFEEDLLPPDAARAAARNASSLPFATLIEHARRLLSVDGSLQVIVPTKACTRFIGLCAMNGLALKRRTDVCTTSRKQPKRTLLHFVRDPYPELPISNTFTLCNADGSRSETYKELTKDFYL